ncbi:MAG: hypothetical protein ACOYK5_05000 [Bacteroidia bacterium]|jgi:hypothetical protein
MRHLLFLLLACVLPIANKLQGQTLQFSRVFLVTANPIQSVPANKVWKVENAMVNWSNQGNPFAIYVNGNPIYVTHEAFPIWLPTGTTLYAASSVYAISVIEFTVVP